MLRGSGKDGKGPGGMGEGTEGHAETKEHRSIFEANIDSRISTS